MMKILLVTFVAAAAAFVFPSHQMTKQKSTQHKGMMLRDLDHFFSDYTFPSLWNRRITLPTLPLLREAASNPDMDVLRSSPRYDIMESENDFKLAVDMPGVRAEDIDVEFEPGRHLLRLSGKREVREGKMKMETRFEKSFTLGSNIDLDNITANASEGVLMVNLPKSEAFKEVKRISVTQKPHAAELSAGEKIAEFTESRV